MSNMRRIIPRIKHKLFLLKHNVINLFLFFIGYRILDARCPKCNSYRVFLNAREISNTTQKALVSRERAPSKQGWAIRLKTNDDGNIIADKNGKPLTYKHKGLMFWEPYIRKGGDEK